MLFSENEVDSSESLSVYLPPLPPFTTYYDEVYIQYIYIARNQNVSCFFSHHQGTLMKTLYKHYYSEMKAEVLRALLMYVN